MFDSARHTTIAALIAVAFCLGAAGCNMSTSVEDSCASITERHCQVCADCAEDEATRASLCDVPEASAAECESFLQTQCERQARILQDPFDELDTCEQALEDETCGELIERDALDRPAPPPACERFL